MGKQHETTPDEPQEAPVQPEKPEIQQPGDPRVRGIPEEAPGNEPVEVPVQPIPEPEIKPDKTGSLLNKTEV